MALEGPVLLSDGSVHTNPGPCLMPQTQDVAEALPLFGAGVLSAVAFKSGSLRLVFDTGIQLNCPADLSFEGWQITGPRGWIFISLPGGDLAIWSDPQSARG